MLYVSSCSSYVCMCLRCLRSLFPVCFCPSPVSSYVSVVLLVVRVAYGCAIVVGTCRLLSCILCFLMCLISSCYYDVFFMLPRRCVLLIIIVLLIFVIMVLCSLLRLVVVSYFGCAIILRISMLCFTRILVMCLMLRSSLSV